MKKATATLLTIIIIICSFIGNLPSFHVHAGTQTPKMTLQQLKDKYPDGKYWNGGDPKSYTSSPCTHHSTKDCSKGDTDFSGWCGCNSYKSKAIQCQGFAYQLASLVYGGDPYASWTPKKTSSAIDSLKAGDIVRYYYGGYAHSIFVTSVSGSTVKFADCNSDGKCKIRWEAKTTKSNLKSNFIYVDVAPFEFNSGNALTIKYSANGGSIPQSNEYKISAEGVALTLCSSTSTSSTALASIPDKTIITVTETKTANDYTWGKTTYDGKTGWCALEYTIKQGYQIKSDVICQNSDSKNVTTVWAYGTGGKNGLWNAASFNLTKKGYTFKGWCKDADGSSTIFDQNDTSLKAEDIDSSVASASKTVTLYAIWEPYVLSINYNANGGDIPQSTEEESKYYVDNGAIYNHSNSQLVTTDWGYGTGGPNGLWNAASLKLSKEGYYFVGWCKDADGSSMIFDQDAIDLKAEDIDADIINGAKSVTLYAIWEEETLSGACGDNATWSLNPTTGLFKIEGTGDMYSYDCMGEIAPIAPWYELRDKITSVEIDDGITSIGGDVFYGCYNLPEIQIPKSVTKISSYAFTKCSSLQSITIPQNITSIGKHAFRECTNLKNVTNNSKIYLRIGSGNNGFVASYAENVINNVAKLGDLDSDGIIDTVDFSKIKIYLVGVDDNEINLDAADISIDGILDTVDLSDLMLILAGASA